MGIDGIGLTKGFLMAGLLPVGALTIANGVETTAKTKSAKALANVFLTLPQAIATGIFVKNRLFSSISIVSAGTLLLLPVIATVGQHLAESKGYSILAKTFAGMNELLTTLNKVIVCAGAIIGLIMAVSTGSAGLIAIYGSFAMINIGINALDAALLFRKLDMG